MSRSIALVSTDKPRFTSSDGPPWRLDRQTDWSVTELCEAVGSNQLFLHYQPQIELPGGSLIGVEALVRWRHPRLGVLAPGTFLPTAERAGLMPALTASVLATAAAQTASWWRAGHRWTMSVNIPTSAVGPALVFDVMRILDTTGLPPEALRFELTEELTLDDARRIGTIIEMLESLGVKISADDFGSGCSSFALLRVLPIDEVKIDRSFVERIGHDRRSRVIVQSMIDLSAALGARSVAEGVEDAATLALLRDMGCDVGQGFFFGRPVPADEIGRALTAQPA